jgi:hypothetical protein
LCDLQRAFNREIARRFGKAEDEVIEEWPKPEDEVSSTDAEDWSGQDDVQDGDPDAPTLFMSV